YMINIKVSYQKREIEEEELTSMEENKLEFSRFYTRKKMMMMSDSIDKISVLPESILHHILSFLDMREVVQTCILSTKWKNIWRYVPVLNLDCFSLLKRYEKKECLSCLDIVSWILFLRHDNNGISIQKIKLSNFFNYDSDQMDTLLLFVVKKKVKEVRLRITPLKDHHHELPHLLFNSILEVFELVDLRVMYSFTLPNSMCSATQLRILKLDCVILPQGNSNGELVLNYPVLEELFLKRCFHHDLKFLIICAPKLKILVIGNRHIGSCKLKICTQSLISFSLSYSFYNDYTLEDLSSLVTATIDGYFGKLSTQTLSKLLNELRNVKTLTISGTRRKNSPGYADILDQRLDTFSNLRCLELIELCCGIRVVSALLRSCPYIETIMVEESK
ncbi:hypothetical protein AQUCO_05000004v1, partial [Aquilegia coerulea]